MVRSCFQSQWRLFTNPDVLVKGRFVFAPPGTPASPVPTWLTSRDWTDDDYSPWLPHGEYDGPRKYWSGRGPARYPPAVVIGRAACFAEGDDPADLSPGTLDGYDLRCWQLAPVPPDPLVIQWDVTSPGHQLILAELINLLYVNPPAAEARLQQLLGPGSVVSVVPNSASPTPGTLIGIQGNLVVIVTSGTSNPQQWALQPLTSLSGPVNLGTFSTLPFWYQAASAVQNRLFTLGVPANARYVLAGHSMGGAISHILAARYLVTTPAENLQIFTLGCPQPGDERLANLTRSLTQVNFINTGDVVTAVPPSGALFDWLAWLIPSDIARGWTRWRTPTNRIGLSPAGDRTVNPPTTDSYTLSFQLVREALLGQPPSVVVAHNMGEYLSRLGSNLPPGGVVEPGTLILYAGVGTPIGYLPCDGSAVSRTVYAALFNALGTTWGPGDGSTTFNLPDLRGRVGVGSGTGAGLSPRTLGQTFGEEEHTQTLAELASHGHGLTDPGHAHDYSSGAATATLAAGATVVPTGFPPGVQTSTDTTGATVDATGSSAPFNVCQPSAVATWLIKT